MFDLGKQFALSHTVASQLIGHDHARNILKAFQQTSEETFGSFGIPPWLSEDVEHDAVLVHGTPKIVLHAPNPDEHLIEVPLVSGPWTSAAGAGGRQNSGRISCTSAERSHRRRQCPAGPGGVQHLES